jgi:glutamyl-tRNA synthetase
MFHVGNARSLLLNWVVARQSGGTLVLRIEDTDAARSRPEWIEGIVRAMAWLGVGPDEYEGPLLQSSYLAEHLKATQQLFDAGRAYYCDCTRDDVQARTGSQHAGYDGYCRTRGLGPGEGRALRFRTPDEGVTVVRDLVRGEPTFENRLMEDFVIARGDGSPVFLLANVVDDITMGITNVIRAEEHLPNTPKQQLLWEALGHEPPTWAHTPLLVNEKRQKLSKRRDKVALEMYRDDGILASAMRNYLMLLGWAPSGDREIVPWSVIEEEFRLDQVNSAPAFFDVRKLTAFNGEYIRAMGVNEFVEACAPWLTGPFVSEVDKAETGFGITAPPWRADAYDPVVFAKVSPLAQTRIGVLSEVVSYVDFLFLDAVEMDEAAWAKASVDSAVLPPVISAFDALPTWEAEPLKEALLAVGEARGLKLGKAQAPVRVAVTGRSVGLPLFESLEVLGRERTLVRLHGAAERAGLSG